MCSFTFLGEHVMSNFTRAVVLGALTLCSVPLSRARAQADAPYTVVKTLSIGGPGRWDYAKIDPDTKLLYVTRSTHEQVIDANTGKVVADFGQMKIAHGTAVVPAVNRGFVTDGGDPA